jgi:hypothetical protein
MSTNHATDARAIVRRVYSEKRKGFDVESRSLCKELREYPSTKAPNWLDCNQCEFFIAMMQRDSMKKSS